MDWGRSTTNEGGAEAALRDVVVSWLEAERTAVAAALRNLGLPSMAPIDTVELSDNPAGGTTRQPGTRLVNALWTGAAFTVRGDTRSS